MRTSKRLQILDAAVTVVERDGVTAVTFESVAAESGLTKGGLLYHFASKDELVLALHQHLADRWESDLVAALGVPVDDVTQDQRLAAYAKVSIRGATGPELLMMLEASTNPVLLQPWQEVIARWVPDPASIEVDDAGAVTRILAWLAADGLWLSESVGGHHLTPELRAVLAERIVDTLGR
ncbi:TetR/AcrR family transcriptional regulator [Rhodococcus gannanensis]|uniref:TetR/AcrR family transcriptional regulator n=1 Tax=Rhodococcus gannanensis TaxID=1960308 RepID=A0ABW4P1E2_9NOCA